MSSMAPKLLMHFNLLIFRYVLFEMSPGKTEEGLIFQMPWYDFKTALYRGRYVKFK